MPEILRSLVVVLTIAMLVFAFAKTPMIEMGMSESDFAIRRNIWFGITAAAFLSNNFWLFCAITTCLLLYAVKRDSNTLALVCSLLFTVPLFGSEIPGMGLVNYFFELTYFRLISLVVLFPLILKIPKNGATVPFGSIIPDKLLIAYVVLKLLLLLETESFTNIMRVAFYFSLDILAPYYAVSRYLKSEKLFRDVILAFVLGTLIVSAIGIFESVKGWMLYSTLSGALGVDWDSGSYLFRGSILRAKATSGDAIVLGYMISVAIGFYFYLFRSVNISKVNKLALLVLLAGGVIAPLSRGPWVGLAVGGIAFLLIGQKPFLSLARALIPTAAIIMVILASPYGENVIDHLPFLGKVDNQNVVYRERLATNSLILIQRHPLFGSSDFLQTPEMEELRWGGDGGIVDLVNTYLSIALSSGLVGLFLFVGFFVAIMVGTYKKCRGINAVINSSRLLGRILISMLMGIMVTIYTVSSISFIPIIYWMVAGMGVAYLNHNWGNEYLKYRVGA